ncbi:uncharacterized protein LOC117181293 [Belonocnema kinseyi]|uniref:uncharacterized protein LOC117181293 n=1 Tax=Belonocnema kinseyi TaxID=2817044 RepID=UPI00143CD710|nr:uncharacterized protein LOC117181293 [Belonocnema kinseyi]
MTARLNQDSLKWFFMLIKDCCGFSEHPDSIIFIQMYRLVSTYSLVKPPKGCNISGGEILDVLLNLKDTNNVDDRWEISTGKIDTIIDQGINYDHLECVAKVLQDHDFFPPLQIMF